MSKVTVVGAGNVGATVGNVLAHKDVVNEVVLLDLKGDMAAGKALDSWQQAPIDYYSTTLKGTADYAETAHADNPTLTDPKQLAALVELQKGLISSGLHSRPHSGTSASRSAYTASGVSQSFTPRTSKSSRLAASCFPRSIERCSSSSLRSNSFN